ncbi:NHL repeat-containing protein [Tropicibacter oceani]|uniref:Uncharacterized protein n=1 Tax=Tropicibacter oceani TaxID=3058420 RepID=A0ABY8QIK0_9RHOB|nr:hypothetical protein [Tropicibacter oceani]WGW04481.1 hypothetical protein QF118_02730 [Tropicibacter oceani]
MFDHGTVVTSGFSGFVTKTPLVRAGDPPPDLAAPRYRYLDPNGTVAALLGADALGRSFDGTEITRSPYDRILARDVGQVFGLAIDDEEFRNLYLTASSAYGLNIIGPDRDNDTLPDRLVRGQPEARWMAGQWGNHGSAGPGSVWKVDGETGQISMLTNITLDGADNTGPGLGNIAFDPDHNQLFVSDLQTGMIHRLDLDGRDLEQFDHGAGLDSPEPHDPSLVVEITDRGFDTEDPESWGFADPARRVWGLAKHGGRLYYAVADGPEVWSVGIDDRTGAFVDDARWELTVKNGFGSGEITDMVFAGDGAMVLARRGERIGAFDHEALTKPRRATVLRYVFEDPEDPDTPSVWVEQPQIYPVGFGAQGEKALGGVDVGPGYDDRGDWSSDFCGATLWTTGERLRDDAPLSRALQPGGALEIDGLQAQPVLLNSAGNRPPWQSFFADYDRIYDGPRVSGHVGDVEVVGCRGQGGHGEDYVSYDEIGDDYGYGDDDDGNGGGGGSCLAPPCGKKPPACLTTQLLARCNPASGEYEVVGIFDDKHGQGLDRLKIDDPSGQISTLPTEQSLLAPFSASLGAMVAGQRGQLNLCAFNEAERDSGQPYACCNATVEITTPDAACEKEAE